MAKVEYLRKPAAPSVQGYYLEIVLSLQADTNRYRSSSSNSLEASLSWRSSSLRRTFRTTLHRICSVHSTAVRSNGTLRLLLPAAYSRLPLCRMKIKTSSLQTFRCSNNRPMVFKMCGGSASLAKLDKTWEGELEGEEGSLRRIWLRHTHLWSSMIIKTCWIRCSINRCICLAVQPVALSTWLAVLGLFSIKTIARSKWQLIDWTRRELPTSPTTVIYSISNLISDK